MAQATADRHTVIGPGTTVSGELRGEESLVVKGRVDGRIQLDDELTIESGGIVQADVEVKTLVVSGVLVGSIRASESVRLTDKARVVGDISAPRVAIEPGAAYRGRIEMGEAGAAAPRAEKQAAASRDTKAPPRMVAPPRSAPTAPPRMVAPPSAAPVAVRPPVPAAPRVATAVVAAPRGEDANGPAWARRKARRR